MMRLRLSMMMFFHCTSLFTMISMIPFAMYYSYFSEFLLHIKARYKTVMMNWGVLAEMGFMPLIPIAIKKNGLHNVLIFGFFYVGGQIYIEKNI
ncbi:MAG: hypothetical protein WCP85_00980 [Mariniphaga sp.]